MRSVSTEQGATRSLRRDARANRERVLSAARSLLGELGLDAPVEEIASRAGVGMGTLYRRFPHKTALVEAVFEEHLEELAAVAEQGLREPDAWEGLLGFLEHALSLQAANRGFAEICAVHRRDAGLLARAQAKVAPKLAELIARAQRAGALRADVTYEDVSLLLWSSGRVVDSTRDVAPGFWRRHLALTLDGLRSAAATPLPHPPLTPAEHRRAMEHLADRLRLAEPRAVRER